MIDIHGNYYPPYEWCRSWDNGRLGIKRDAIFSDLYNEFNTTKIPLQTMEAFYYDVDSIAREAPTRKAFRAALLERKNRRLAQLRKVLVALNHEYTMGCDNLSHDCKVALHEGFHELSCDSILRFLVCLIPGTPETFTPATEDNPNDDPYYRPPPSESDPQEIPEYIKEMLAKVEESDFVDSPPGYRCQNEPDAQDPSDIRDNNTGPRLIDFTENSNNTQLLKNCSPGMPESQISSLSEPHPADNASEEPHMPAEMDTNSKGHDSGCQALAGDVNKEAKVKAQEPTSPGLISPPRPLCNTDSSRQTQPQNEPPPDAQDTAATQTLRNVESFCENTPSSDYDDEYMDFLYTDSELSFNEDDIAGQDDEDATVSFDDIPRATTAALEPVPSANTTLSSDNADNTAILRDTVPTTNTVSSLDDAICHTATTNITASTATETDDFVTTPMTVPADMTILPSTEAAEDYSFYDEVDMDDPSLILDDASLDAINAGLHRKRKAPRKKRAEKRHPGPSASHAPNKVSKKHQRAKSRGA